MRVSSSEIDSPPYRFGSRRPTPSRLTPFRTSICIRGTVLGDERVECGPDVGLGKLLLARTVVGEEDDAQPALLVAQKGLPGPRAVDANRLRRKRPIHRGRIPPGEPKGRLEAEGDGAPVGELVAGGGFERV